mmetsp:Transcript_42244/g.122156  ORF Transcript_42244/g.122156 Transcript_42244/m.122156 type:complete len:288 (+) Transcript_42244:211-1074(+)
MQHIVTYHLHLRIRHQLALQQVQLLMEARATVIHEDQAKPKCANLVDELWDEVTDLPCANLCQARALRDVQHVASNAHVQWLHLEAGDAPCVELHLAALDGTREADARVAHKRAKLQAHAVPSVLGMFKHAVNERPLQVCSHFQPVVELLQRELDHGLEDLLCDPGTAGNHCLNMLDQHGKLVLRVATVAGYLRTGECVTDGCLVDIDRRVSRVLRGPSDNLLNVTPQWCQHPNQVPDATLMDCLPRGLAPWQHDPQVKDIDCHTSTNPFLKLRPQACVVLTPLERP